MWPSFETFHTKCAGEHIYKLIAFQPKCFGRNKKTPQKMTLKENIKANERIKWLIWNIVFQYTYYMTNVQIYRGIQSLVYSYMFGITDIKKF